MNTNSPQEIREKTFQILQRERGRFVSSSELADLLDEEPMRITKTLYQERDKRIIAKPGGGGGYMLPTDDSIDDPFHHFGQTLFGIVLRFLSTQKEFLNAWQIAKGLRHESWQSIQKTLQRNKDRVPDGWTLVVTKRRGYKLYQDDTQG